MLERVRYSDYYNGINVEAFTDGYAFDDYSCLYLLSAAGYEGSVRAITSALVSGRAIEILSGKTVEAYPVFGQKYRILSTRILPGLLHQIVLVDGLLKPTDDREKLIYMDKEKNPAEAVYEAVRDGYPVPMITEWSDWLYERLNEKGYLERLHGNRKILKLILDEDVLDSMVSEGVRNGEISF